jgi:hypothetical protein
MCAGGGLSASGKELEGELRSALLDCTPSLRDTLMGSYCEDDESLTRRWFSLCEEAMHALYHVHPCPDVVLGSIIGPLFGSLSGSLSPTDELSSSLSSGAAKKTVCSAARLSRMLFVLGQGALCTLVYTEQVADLAKKASDKKAKAKPIGGEGEKKEGEAEVADEMEEAMGMAAAADADHERVFNHIVERQLVFENTLGKFHPLIAYMVADEKGSFSDPLVRETGLLALCRYMSVSNSLCELYLPLLFTALEREGVSANRTTVMIALGDLAFRSVSLNLYDYCVEPYLYCYRIVYYFINTAVCCHIIRAIIFTIV